MKKNKLELVYEKKLEKIVHIKKYKYGDFLIKIKIDPNGFYVMNAESKNDVIEVVTSTNADVVIKIQNLYLSIENLNKFIQELSEAAELAEIIKKQKNELLK